MQLPRAGLNIPFSQTKASFYIDILRAVAALLVLLEHGRNLMYVDYPQLPAHRGLLLAPYLISAAGHQAVIVFFVLSGYLISGSVFRSMGRGNWTWKLYLTHRLTRLWIVLIPGLLLGMFWDVAGIRSQIAPLLYAGMVQNHMLTNYHPSFTPRIFFGNMFFLQTIRVPLLGSNGALWSLANEFWYYILFPLGLLALRSNKPLWKRLIYAVLFVVVAAFVGKGIFLLFPIWLFGYVLTMLPQLKLGWQSRAAACLVYFPMMFYMARTRLNLLSGLSGDYIFGVATFLLIWILLSANSRVRTTPFVNTGREWARFSYSLYVLHTPFLLFLVALFIGDTRMVPSVKTGLLGLFIFGVAIAYSYFMARITEFHTDAVRSWVETKIGIKGPNIPSTSMAVAE